MKDVFTIDGRSRGGPFGRSGHGFSLPEVLVVLVILAIATGLVAVTFKAAIDSRNISLARIDVMEKARSSLELIGREIQSAFINELGYLSNSFDFQGVFPSSPFSCNEIRVDAGTGGYYVSPALDWFEMVQDIPREIPGNNRDDDGDGLVDEIQIRFTGKAGIRVNGLDDDGDGLTDEDGAIIDEDGDGRFDEDPIDGIDNDHDGSTDEDPSNSGRDDDGDGLTDEDGIYPGDMLNFAVARSREEERLYDIAEIGYTVGVWLQDGDYTTRLLRRVDGLRLGDEDITPMDGQFIGVDGLHDGRETDFTIFYANTDPAYDVDVDILSFDTVGVRFTYWYFNYAVAQEMEPFDGDCSRFGRLPGLLPIDNDADGRPDEEFLNGLDDDADGRIDEDPGRGDEEICKGPWRQVRFWESSLERYPNEEEDINIEEITPTFGDRCDPVRLRAIEHMDGLPDMVEIELWVLDQERRSLSPRHLSTRVQIPSGRRW